MSVSKENDIGMG